MEKRLVIVSLKIFFSAENANSSFVRSFLRSPVRSFPRFVSLYPLFFAPLDNVKNAVQKKQPRWIHIPHHIVVWGCAKNINSTERWQVIHLTVLFQKALEVGFLKHFTLSFVLFGENVHCSSFAHSPSIFQRVEQQHHLLESDAVQRNIASLGWQWNVVRQRCFHLLGWVDEW